MENHPQLNKQSHNTMTTFGKYLIPVDLDNLFLGLFSKFENIRISSISTLSEYPPLLLNKPKLFKEKLYQNENEKLNYFIFLSTHDHSHTVSTMAKKIMESKKINIGKDFLKIYLPLLSNNEEVIRKMAALALSSSLRLYKEEFNNTLDILYNLFKDSFYPKLTKYDGYESEINLKLGISETIYHSSDIFDYKTFSNLFQFLIKSSLNDPIDKVKNEYVNAGIKVVQTIGKDYKNELLKLFEKYLNENEKSENFFVTGTVVIFLGSLAPNFISDESKLQEIVKRLFKCLKIPVEKVQKSSSSVLTPLVKYLDESFVQDLLKEVFEEIENGSYGNQRGYSYALTSIVSGLGIKSLKDFEIMLTLEKYSNSKSKTTREGSLVAYEILSTIGVLFEPYLPNIFIDILNCFSDSDENIQTSAREASNKIMANISGHGVRIVIPEILKGLNSENWKTKKASVQLLGTMAFCAPRQLSSCLPIVVSNLMLALHYTHSEVSSQAFDSLKRVGGVVANPEIATHVPQLLKAISDPDYTENVLESLLHTRFVHSIDAASLSLLIPVLYRGLDDRKSDSKKMAAKIVGSMTLLITDKNVISPYVPKLLPMLLNNLSDPSMEVRSASSKALGTLGNNIDKKNEEMLFNWLMTSLTKDSNVAERAGAAQGLSEFISLKSDEELDEIIPKFIEGLSSSKDYIRHGHFQLFIFLPPLLKSKFIPFLNSALPIILEGLSDQNETIRDSSFQSCKIIVGLHAATSVDLILEPILLGLDNSQWRTRMCSTIVLGEFLEKISDHYDTRNEKDKKKEFADETIVDCDILRNGLGKETANRIISKVFLQLYDPHTSVQQESTILWKSMVFNTSRTLREVMISLVHLLIEQLAKESEIVRTIASKAMGDMVQKLGHKSLLEIIPLLKESLSSEVDETRQGVLLSLSEIMIAVHKNVNIYVQNILPIIKFGICDLSPKVQDAASIAFNSLVKLSGSEVVSDVISNLINDLKDKKLHSLTGFRQIVKVRADLVLPKLLPILLKDFNEFYAKAITSIIDVSGIFIGKYISQILDLLILKVGENPSTSEYVESLEATMKAIDEELLPLAMKIIASYLSDSRVIYRKGSSIAAKLFFKATELDFNEEIPNIVEKILYLYNDPESEVLQLGVETFTCLIDVIPKSLLQNHLANIREVVKSITENSEKSKIIDTLPGLDIERGIDPFIKLYSEGLIFGKTTEIKEQSALGFNEVINLSNDIVIKKSTSKLLGPLIRVCVDRIVSQIKEPTLSSILILLDRGGPTKKQFLPQIQSIFIKSLHDPVKSVRDLTVKSFEKLIELGTKMDTLLIELMNQLKEKFNLKEKEEDETIILTSEESIISMLESFKIILLKSGKKNK
jgi:HEAT repeat protein